MLNDCSPLATLLVATMVSPPRSAAWLRARVRSSVATFCGLRLTTTLLTTETVVELSCSQLPTSFICSTATFSPFRVSFTKLQPLASATSTSDKTSLPDCFMNMILSGITVELHVDFDPDFIAGHVAVLVHAEIQAIDNTTAGDANGGAAQLAVAAAEEFHRQGPRLRHAEEIQFTDEVHLGLPAHHGFLRGEGGLGIK